MTYIHGLRKCELLTLKKEDFIFKRMFGFYFPIKLVINSPKTHKVRSIDLDFKISFLFMLYLKNLEKDELLFKFNDFYISNNFGKIFKSSKNKRKIKQIRFADIRHIHASYLLSNCKNKANCMKMVQERLRAF